jgi:hypothetical protein
MTHHWVAQLSRARRACRFDVPLLPPSFGRALPTRKTRSRFLNATSHATYAGGP